MISVGESVGAVEGAGVALDGDVVGVGVGPRVGIWVGSRVGLFVAFAVGPFDGTLVGVVVGALVSAPDIRAVDAIWKLDRSEAKRLR